MVTQICTIALYLPAVAVEAMLAFVYEGDCPVDEESLVPLLEAASYLQVKALEVELRRNRQPLGPCNVPRSPGACSAPVPHRAGGHDLAPHPVSCRD